MICGSNAGGQIGANTGGQGEVYDRELRFDFYGKILLLRPRYRNELADASATLGGVGMPWPAPPKIYLRGACCGFSFSRRTSGRSEVVVLNSSSHGRTTEPPFGRSCHPILTPASGPKAAPTIPMS